MSDPRFPIGKPEFRTDLTAADRKALVDRIEATPAALNAAIEGLDQSQLDTPYRDGGWTVQQLVHHVFDSHCNAFIRFRLALTEDHPRITAYDQAAWAELADATAVPVSVSAQLIEGLHQRWVAMLHAFDESDWSRTLDHPENGDMSLDDMLQMYAWHGDHHVRHITALREAKGW